MTDIDTTAIRAFYADEPHDDPLYADLLVVLRALDAARTERDEAKIVAQSWRDECGLDIARAEAAERKAVDFEGRYETSHASRMWAEECFRNAEARITAALEEHPNPWQGECGDPEHCSQPGNTCEGCFEDWPCATVRALTGGTE